MKTTIYEFGNPLFSFHFDTDIGFFSFVGFIIMLSIILAILRWLLRSFLFDFEEFMGFLIIVLFLFWLFG